MVIGRYSVCCMARRKFSHWWKIKSWREKNIGLCNTAFACAPAVGLLRYMYVSCNNWNFEAPKPSQWCNSLFQWNIRVQFKKKKPPSARSNGHYFHAKRHTSSPCTCIGAIPRQNSNAKNWMMNKRTFSKLKKICNLLIYQIIQSYEFIKIYLKDIYFL